MKAARPVVRKPRLASHLRLFGLLNMALPHSIELKKRFEIVISYCSYFNVFYLVKQNTP